jgi:hypothetical protein
LGASAFDADVVSGWDTSAVEDTRDWDTSTVAEMCGMVSDAPDPTSPTGGGGCSQAAYAPWHHQPHSSELQNTWLDGRPKAHLHISC